MRRHVELMGGLTLLHPHKSIVPQTSPALPFCWVLHSIPLREILESKVFCDKDAHQHHGWFEILTASEMTTGAYASFGKGRHTSDIAQPKPSPSKAKGLVSPIKPSLYSTLSTLLCTALKSAVYSARANKIETLNATITKTEYLWGWALGATQYGVLVGLELSFLG